MESKKEFINLNEPWMEQQAFRDFLKQLNEQPKSEIDLNDLLQAAKAVIENELVARGYSAQEFVGINLKCQVVQKENIEQIANTYSAEWGNCVQNRINKLNLTSLLEVPTAVDGNENILSSEFTGKLIERLDEVIMGFSSLVKLDTPIANTSLTMNFNSDIVTESLECRLSCEKEGIPYKKNLKTGKCTHIPCDITMRRPDS